MRTNSWLFRLVVLTTVVTSLGFVQSPAFGAASPPDLALSVEIGGVPATAPIPRLPEGTPINLVFTATNTGAEPLTGLVVVDSELGPIACTETSLAAGASTACEIDDVVRLGRHRSDAVASASASDGSSVEASFRVGYRGTAFQWVAAVELEVLVGGLSGDSPGPVLDPGAAVEFTYRVTNVGTVPLERLKVADKSHRVTCPTREIEPGQIVECTAEATVEDGRFRGRAVARAWDDRGERAVAVRRFAYVGEEPLLRAEFEAVALADGIPGPSAPGPMVRADRSIAWAIDVTNTGDDHLWGVYARDLAEGEMACSARHLAPGESTRCTVWGWAVGGPMAGEIEVSAWASDERHLTVMVPRHAFGYRPGADLLIETYVDGFDADAHAGPRRLVGTTLSLTYRVYNTGTVDLAKVKVRDALFGPVLCPKKRIASGKSMVCTKEITAELGWWETAGKARGFDGNQWVRDSDKTFWHVRTVARVSSIDLRVTIGGVDAASAPGPKLVTGRAVEIVYRATNTGNSPLWSMEMRDPGVPDSEMTCSDGGYVLPGEVVTCRANIVVESGKQVGSIEAVAWNSDGTRIVGTDTIYYRGKPGPT